MSLTLGLNTAISGLMTNQRQLDVIAQNVSNVNTPGYTRKVLNQESRVLAGYGAGVQTGSITRSVDEGLLKHLRAEQGKLADVKVVDQYLERLGQQFGTPADNTSISHVINEFAENLEALATQVGKQTSYLGAVRAAQDVTDKIQRMSAEISQLRADADVRIADVVTQINDKIDEIHTLNNLIIKNNATGAGTEDLVDKRDAALSELSEFIDIKYYNLADGGIAVYTSGGMLMVDSTPQYLSHTAMTSVDATATKADGTLDGITIGGIDITNDIRSGELKGLITIRDDQLTNFQAGLDRLASELMTRINAAHNRGTSHPDPMSSLTGTRRFADQDNITQQIRLAGTSGDTMLTVLDANGEQVAVENLDEIMTDAGHPSRGWWTVNQVTTAVQNWLQANGAPAATVGLNSDGQLAIDLKNASYTMAFRDQVDGNAGSDTADVTIEFDMDGDGSAEQSVEGFSSFFGLRDLFTTGKPNWLFESSIQPGSITTTVNRNIRLYDQSGQVGSNITIPAGYSLEQAAALINKHATSVDSMIKDAAYTIPAPSAGKTLTLSLPSGTVGTYTAVAGDTLADIATAITAMGLTATVVDDQGGERVRVTNSSGVEITPSGDLASELGFEARQLVKASVVPEGSGYRLRMLHSEGGEMFIGADVDGGGHSFLTDFGIGPGAAGKSATVQVNQTYVEAPYLISRGSPQYDATRNIYYTPEGDNTTALQLAAAAADKGMVKQSGNLGAGSFNLTEYGSALISLTAREHGVVKGQLDYQSKLTSSIEFQHQNLAGVNVDEEVANLITYQQAYGAS
ncbi:MAG TPA: flagellar hook-associated protein FlgK, partial [Candidatus Omnitrophota bacterium]|nr:flagellar hook-associated protein FlgK [Candidatus Omnitrophota bacterium]